MPGGGARGKNLVHPQKLGFLCLKFSGSLYFGNHLSEKHSYLDHRYRVGFSFHSMTSDLRVHVGGLGLEVTI